MAAPGPNAEVYGDKEKSGFFGDLDCWRRTPGFRSFVLESPAAEIAATVMRSSKATLLYDQLLVKEIGSEEKTPWHQDQPYWAVSGRQICSIWVPMDPIDEASSPEYIRASHHWGEFNPQHFDDHSPYRGTGLPPLPDIEAERQTYDITRFAMAPGDCLLFQAMIVHGAPGNASTTYRRRGYASRWLGDDARYCERSGEVAIPTFETTFRHGDEFSGKMFPTVYRSPAT
jgi:ectoine hydroxylase-related dioxygenase (phytanoyl-CoA dioxygenase family)